MTTAVGKPAMFRTQAVLDRMHTGYASLEIKPGEHQANMRLMAWHVGAVAKHLFDRHPLRDTLQAIALIAVRWVPFSWELVCEKIVAERERQQALLAAGRFDFNCASAHVSNVFKLPVLMEEIGEVAEAILDGDCVNLSVELLQVATVCVAWLEALEAQAA